MVKEERTMNTHQLAEWLYYRYSDEQVNYFPSDDLAQELVLNFMNYSGWELPDHPEQDIQFLLEYWEGLVLANDKTADNDIFELMDIAVNKCLVKRGK